MGLDGMDGCSPGEVKYRAAYAANKYFLFALLSRKNAFPLRPLRKPNTFQLSNIYSSKNRDTANVHTRKLFHKSNSYLRPRQYGLPYNAITSLGTQIQGWVRIISLLQRAAALRTSWSGLSNSCYLVFLAVQNSSIGLIVRPSDQTNNQTLHNITEWS